MFQQSFVEFPQARDALHHGRFGPDGQLHACRRSWQWHVLGWFLWCCSLLIVLDRLMTCPLACRFFWPCTQVHGQGFSRHQGGEGVARTLGACSQVFCHPIRCIVRTRQDRLAVSLIICTTHTTPHHKTPQDTTTTRGRYGHGLTSRPRESCDHQFLTPLLKFFGYTDGAVTELFAGTLKLRYSSTPFSMRFPSWTVSPHPVIPVPFSGPGSSVHLPDHDPVVQRPAKRFRITGKSSVHKRELSSGDGLPVSTSWYWAFKD